MKPGSPIAVLANPIAYRVVALLASRGAHVTDDIAAAVPDVPRSSLYRQLARLRDAGVVTVIAERKARGAVERTYALASRTSAVLNREDVMAAPVAELRAALQQFAASMTADIVAFSEKKEFAQSRSHTNASMVVSDLTDADYTRAVREISGALRRATARSKRQKSAKRRHFYIVALPQPGSV